tara:strand:+ start:228 stop:1235 length:1008 start_codon:yes stop_codon:yes gene_type:complete
MGKNSKDVYYSIRGRYLFIFTNAKQGKSETPIDYEELGPDTRVNYNEQDLIVMIETKQRTLSLKAADLAQLSAWVSEIRLASSRNKQAPMATHTWAMTRPKKPTWCYVNSCKKFVWRQDCMFCSKCGILVHVHCQQMVRTPCDLQQSRKRMNRKMLEQNEVADDEDVHLSDSIDAKGNLRPAKIHRSVSSKLLLPFLCLEHSMVYPVFSPNNGAEFCSWEAKRDLLALESSKLREKICLKQTSTYPRDMQSPEKLRLGDPIADQYKLRVYENRIVFALADGCSWGERPRMAAQKACEGFVSYLTENLRKINNTGDAGTLMLQALSEAHGYVCCTT